MTSGSTRLLVGALAVLAVSGLGAQTACITPTCNTPKYQAAQHILDPWCRRYIECDPSRGEVQTCIDNRIAIAQVPDDEGCAACTDQECERSTCSDAKIEKCAQDSRAMACADQVNGQLVAFPSSCDSCFR